MSEPWKTPLRPFGPDQTLGDYVEQHQQDAFMAAYQGLQWDTPRVSGDGTIVIAVSPFADPDPADDDEESLWVTIGIDVSGRNESHLEFDSRDGLVTLIRRLTDALHSMDTQGAWGEDG